MQPLMGGGQDGHIAQGSKVHEPKVPVPYELVDRPQLKYLVSVSTDLRTNMHAEKQNVIEGQVKNLDENCLGVELSTQTD